MSKLSSFYTKFFYFWKIDEEDKRKILIEEKDENIFHFNIFEVTAKSWKNIVEAIKKICEVLIEKK